MTTVVRDRDESVEIIDMVDSSPPPSPVGGKRKASDESDNKPDSGKKAKASALVELKGRKLVFNQPAFERPPVPRRLLLELQMDLLDASEGKPMAELPEKFYDLIVIAGHELSSATEAAFMKAIKTELIKGQDDILPLDLLSDPVKKLFTLKQYGFHSTDFGMAQSRFPAGLQIRCWEANEMEKYLPDDSVEQALNRRAERERARQECIRLAEEMDDAEKHELVKGDKSKDDTMPSATKTKQTAAKSRDGTPTTPSASSPMKRQKTGDEDSSKKKEEREAALKQKQEEKEAKLAEQEERRKEREEKAAEREEKRKELEEKKAEREEKREEKRRELDEKKAQRDREVQKKAAVKAKQAQMFGAFFAKQAKKEAKAGPSTVSANPVESSSSNSGLSDFDRLFQPPPKRSNVRWAPINEWDLSKLSNPPEESVVGWTPRDFINDHLSRHNRSIQTPRTHLPPGLKSAPLHGSVADMWAEYQAAEDPRLVRRRLLNIDKFPRKTLAFDQQARPPYRGTFTKASLVVGPRTPFQQDPLFDYSYDSGDDWQEDEGGDDVDCGDQDPEGDEDGSDDDEEGEFDDWLDNAEDVLFGPDATGLAPDVAGDVPMLSSTPPPPSTDSPNRLVPKRKVPVKRITKLNQDCQGPFWENEIGCHPEEEWSPYRIQMLNDAPSSLDPFQYQSAEPVQHFKATFSDIAVGLQVGIKCLLNTTEDTDARKAAQVAAAPPVMPLGDASSTANTPGVRSRSAKNLFPPSRLPEFFEIAEGSSKNQADLVLELRTHFPDVTKAAVEAKLREVATRIGKGKDAKWQVNTEAYTAEGITPPPRGVQALFTKAS